METAKRTVKATTQRCGRSEEHTLSRNYSTNDRMLRYKHIKECFFMDTFFATKTVEPSLRGHTCMQLFVTDKGFIHVVPMKSKSEVLQAVKQFAKEIGAPDAIICDAAGEQTSRDLRKFCLDMGTTLRVLEENTPWANKAELYIGLLKEAVRRDISESNSPLVLWDYCAERRARINNMTAKDLFQLHGQTPHATVHGEEGDISNLCQFDWYEWCHFLDKKVKFPKPRKILGRVLGPAHGVGNEMCQWILKANGRVVARRTCRPLKVEEVNSPTEQSKRRLFDAEIEGRLGSSITQPPSKTMSKQRKLQNSDDTEEDQDDFLENSDFIFCEDDEET